MGNGMSIEEKVGRHDERLQDLESFKVDHQKEHVRLMEMIKRIENRPSWAVVALITSMASAIVYLIMKVLEQPKTVSAIVYMLEKWGG